MSHTPRKHCLDIFPLQNSGIVCFYLCRCTPAARPTCGLWCIPSFHEHMEWPHLGLSTSRLLFAILPGWDGCRRTKWAVTPMLWVWFWWISQPPNLLSGPSEDWRNSITTRTLYSLWHTNLGPQWLACLLVLPFFEYRLPVQLDWAAPSITEGRDMTEASKALLWISGEPHLVHFLVSNIQTLQNIL